MVELELEQTRKDASDQILFHCLAGVLAYPEQQSSLGALSFPEQF